MGVPMGTGWGVSPGGRLIVICGVAVGMMEGSAVG